MATRRLATPHLNCLRSELVAVWSDATVVGSTDLVYHNQFSAVWITAPLRLARLWGREFAERGLACPHVG